MLTLSASHGHPEAVLDEQLRRFAESGADSHSFVLEFSFCQYYLPSEPRIELLALVLLTAQVEGTGIQLSIFPPTREIVEQLANLEAEPELLMNFALEQKAPWLDLKAPLSLAPISLSKAWGREIWYTGIEARGQSKISAQGFSVPLPWLLALAPRRLVANQSRELMLLKVLDPYPAEVYGDLYFEVHQQKREVYVVTQIDKQAWGGNIGGIRYGFNPQKRAKFSRDLDFKQAYLSAVKAYESVRRKIDDQLDEQRQRAGIPLDEPVAVEFLSRWQQELDPALVDTEHKLRTAMEAFTAVRSLRVGEVVKVPPLTPHSLLHGVQVIEFQTPDYERKILSFGQKVLNQPHWDTAEVLDQLNLDTPPQHPPRRWVPGPGVEVELLADVEAFALLRVKMQPNQQISLARLKKYFPAWSPEPCYLLAMGLEGELNWTGSNAVPLRPSEAQLVPTECESTDLSCGAQGASFLLAMPGRLGSR